MGWVWVRNLVCVSWVWVRNLVCIAWALVSYTVCILWTTVVELVCLSWAWTVYWICHFPEAVQNLLLWIRINFVIFGQCLRPKDTERNPLEKQGWKLTFDDDFTLGAIDPSKWDNVSYDGSRYDGQYLPQGIIPVQYFSPTNFAFTSSTIKLIADKQPTTINNDPRFNGSFTIPYTTAMLAWTGNRPVGQQYGPYDQLYGYFEIRCKIPDTPYQWPAFWLVSRASWPPEIDIFEFFTTSNTNRFSTTQHWGKVVNNKHPEQGRDFPVCSPSLHFHIYACEWTATEIRWYYDNYLIRVATDGISDFIYEMLVEVNSGIQGGGNNHPENSTYPNYFEVDYVRAYSR